MSDTPTTSTSLSAAAPPNIRELVITLFELGREVTSVLDLDELLREDSPADRPADQVPRVRGLPARRGRRGAADRLLGRLSGRLRADAAAEGRPGPGRRRGRGRHADSRQRRARRSALRRSGARIARRAGRAAAAQGPRDRRAQPAQRHAGPVHRDRRDDPAAVRRARRGRRSRTRGCSSRSASTPSTLETLAEIAREFGAILNLDELLTRIAQPRRAA